MMSFLLRKLWYRKRGSNSGKTPCPTSTFEENNRRNLQNQGQSPRSRLPNVTFSSHPIQSHCNENETEILVNRLAALAATVSNNANNEHQSNEAPSTHTSEEAEVKPAEEEETFHYLTSLITVSYQQTPTHALTPSVSTFASKSGSGKSQIFDRKRASSILSLHIDLPASPLSFPSLIKGPRKQRPIRYSPLPPPFAQKALFIRPEVRF
jgi:hypothetical protein